jgi:hypothetical protein
MKVFVFGYYGYNNTGDDAMALAIANELRKRKIDFNLYQRGQGIVTTICHFMRSNVILIGGGSHLRNWGKGWWFCSGRVLFLGIVSRLLFKKFKMVNVGSGGVRLDWLAKVISNKVTIRDKETMDSAVLLEYKPRPKEKVLGINLQSISSIYYDDYKTDEDLLQAVCQLVKAWWKLKPDWEVSFISFNGNDYYPDDAICFSASLRVSGSKFYRYNEDVTAVLSEMSRYKAFVGMRYHSLVFAYITNTPFIAIQTYPRCKFFNNAINNPVKPIDMDSIIKGNLLPQLVKLCHPKYDVDDYWLTLKNAKALALKGIDV